jgi:hypothetical protein
MPTGSRHRLITISHRFVLPLIPELLRSHRNSPSPSSTRTLATSRRPTAGRQAEHRGSGASPDTTISTASKGEHRRASPAAFQYEKATSVEHALQLLATYGPRSRVVAGGHSLLPMMKLRLAYPRR